MNYKYIKKINWPWVEVIDNFEGESTITININSIDVVWPNKNGYYSAGIRMKNGDWLEDHLPVNALKELQDLIINRHSTCEHSVMSYNPEILHEEQTMYEWLNEEGQA